MNEVTSVAVAIEECGGLDKLEALQTHENEQIYLKVLQIIDNYFSSVSEPKTLFLGVRFISGFPEAKK